MQHLNPSKTTWHITFGTHGARLHGSYRPTVDHQHNQFGEPFLPADPKHVAFVQALLKHEAVYLTREQRRFIETQIPEICARGGWVFRQCAAGEDHVHVLCDVDRAVHGKQVRHLLKRWLRQALDSRWPRAADADWWAVGGSTKAVKDEAYLNNAFDYVTRQRATEATRPE